MKHRLATAAIAVVGLLGAALQPAAADPVDDLRASLKAAFANVKSMQLNTTFPDGTQVIAATTVFNPLMSHVHAFHGTDDLEMYGSDGYRYQRLGNGPWGKVKVPPRAYAVELIPEILAAPNMTIVPDVPNGAVPYGSFAVQTTPDMHPPPPTTLTCTYDKRTFLIHTCVTGSGAIDTFSKYNDPGNAIVIPPEALAGAEAN